MLEWQEFGDVRGLFARTVEKDGGPTLKIETVVERNLFRNGGLKCPTDRNVDVQGTLYLFAPGEGGASMWKSVTWAYGLRDVDREHPGIPASRQKLVEDLKRNAEFLFAKAPEKPSENAKDEHPVDPSEKKGYF